jgi:hypothetical protein
MATIEIIIRDDHGNTIESRARKEYKLDLGNQSFNAIEAAVGTFKNVALPDLKADLLKEAQDNFIKKKRPIKAKWHKSSPDQDTGWWFSI